MDILLSVGALLSWAFADLMYTHILKKHRVLPVTLIAQFAGGLLLLLFINEGEGTAIELGSYWIWIAILGLLNLLGIITLMKAYQSKGLALSSPVVHAWVVPLSVLGMIFWGEFPSALQWTSIAVIVGGLFFISVEKREQLRVDPLFVFAFASMLIWSLSFFLIKGPSLEFGNVVIPAGLKLMTGLMVLPLVFLPHFELPKSWKDWAFVAVIGCFDGLGLLAFVTASTLSPSIAVVAGIVAAGPAVAALLARLVLKEKLSKWQSFGVAVVSLGLILIAL